MALTVEEHMFLVEHYFKTASFRECQIAFKSPFGGHTKLSESVIWKLMKQFRETGCMNVKKRTRRSRVVTTEKVNGVWERMEESRRNL